MCRQVHGPKQIVHFLSPTWTISDSCLPFISRFSGSRKDGYGVLRPPVCMRRCFGIRVCHLRDLSSGSDPYTGCGLSVRTDQKDVENLKIGHLTVVYVSLIFISYINTKMVNEQLSSKKTFPLCRKFDFHVFRFLFSC